MPYIYKIVNKINNKIYIGKTLSTIEERFKEHCRDYKRRNFEKRPLYSAMNKYGIENFYIEEIEECLESVINEREEFWIKELRTYVGFPDCNGYNATLGGDGTAYLDRQLLIKTYEEIGTIKGTATFLNIDPGNLSRILKNNGITVKSSQEHAKKKGIKVSMLDKNSLEFIKNFNSFSEASTYILNEQEKEITESQIKGISSHIRDVCNGKRKTAYGYIWKKIE